jgi:hypothetical protein
VIEQGYLFYKVKLVGCAEVKRINRERYAFPYKPGSPFIRRTLERPGMHSHAGAWERCGETGKSFILKGETMP